MGFLKLFRMTYLFAGAASFAGIYYMLAQDARLVNTVYQTFDEDCESLNKRITSLKNQKGAALTFDEDCESLNKRITALERRIRRVQQERRIRRVQQ